MIKHWYFNIKLTNPVLQAISQEIGNELKC